MLVLVDDTGAIFAGCIDVPWEDREGVAGEAFCRLVCLAPKFGIRPTKLFHCLKRPVGHHGLSGTGFGDSPDHPEAAGLWLDADFKKGSTTIDPTLAPGLRRELTVRRFEVVSC